MVTVLSKEDIEVITRQLNRAPRGLKGIVSRCEHADPQVIETRAFIDADKPFPTIYWLTCPFKVKLVSRLEDAGWAERIEEEMTLDENLAARFLDAQEDYRIRRRLSAHGVDHPVFETGIAGVKDLRAVKCLHAHYAHYLATGNNPIGEMVDKKIVGIECKERCGRR